MDRTNTKIVYDAIRSQFPPEYKRKCGRWLQNDASASLMIKEP
jgi:hypothetical protein